MTTISRVEASWDQGYPPRQKWPSSNCGKSTFQETRVETTNTPHSLHVIVLIVLSCILQPCSGVGGGYIWGYLPLVFRWTVIFSASTSTHRTTLLQPCVDYSWDSVLSFPQCMHFQHLNILPHLMWTYCCKAPYHNLPAAEPRFLQESSGWVRKWNIYACSHVCTPHISHTWLWS